MSIVLVVRMKVAEGNEERTAEESRERAFYETVVD
jgi:hypothetical protein